MLAVTTHRLLPSLLSLTLLFGPIFFPPFARAEGSAGTQAFTFDETGRIKKLIGTGGGVRLVYREWPILNEGSVFAAKAALASQVQGKYEEFHWALMDLKRVTRDSTLELAASIGLDIDRLQADMEAPRINKHIEVSMALARELGFSGTPSFVIGEETAPVPFETYAASLR